MFIGVEAPGGELRYLQADCLKLKRRVRQERMHSHLKNVVCSILPPHKPQAREGNDRVPELSGAMESPWDGQQVFKLGREMIGGLSSAEPWSRLETANKSSNSGGE
jgi:hypothetical protein